jgi:hypothetical protein
MLEKTKLCRKIIARSYHANIKLEVKNSSLVAERKNNFEFCSTNEQRLIFILENARIYFRTLKKLKKMKN